MHSQQVLQDILTEADSINKFLNDENVPSDMDFVDALSSAETKLRQAAETIKTLEEQLT